MGLAKDDPCHHPPPPQKGGHPHLQETAPGRDVAWEEEVGTAGPLAFREAQDSGPCGKDYLSHKLVQRLGKPAGRGTVLASETTPPSSTPDLNPPSPEGPPPGSSVTGGGNGGWLLSCSPPPPRFSRLHPQPRHCCNRIERGPLQGAQWKPLGECLVVPGPGGHCHLVGQGQLTAKGGSALS